MRFVKIFIILIFITLTSCLDNGKTVEFNPDLPLKEETEAITFQGEKGDVDKILKFELYKMKYSLELSFENDILNHFNNAERNLQYYTDEQPENATEEFYNIFLNDDNDLALLEGILESLRNRNIGNDYDMVQLITSFVQSLPYEIAEPQKYPYETLYLNKGDCSDKSVLLCKLFILEGYDVCLFSYDKAKHMSVGLKVDENEDSYNSGYIYIESTAIIPIGEIPTELVGGIKIDEAPNVILPKENGDNTYNEFNNLKLFYSKLTKMYGEEYLSTSIKGKNLLEQMQMLALKNDSLQDEQSSMNHVLDSLKIVITEKGCGGTVPESIYEDCMKINKLYNKFVKNYNNLNTLTVNSNEIYNQKVNLFNSLKK
ncbi:hypothetical protein [Aequorivita sp. CIP111184]|uniref:hypothetical protein n=1 Tax=Aequorivita sp. CIP111184 TaxID=2211356 RepID=UPI000DBBD77E|nr:hypothetical protein [Aequorivita sp. CIP111184]SRX56219.1 hypothetical protein AEQU1_03249 [Aequorivita sp. CIP111184]